MAIGVSKAVGRNCRRLAPRTRAITEASLHSEGERACEMWGGGDGEERSGCSWQIVEENNEPPLLYKDFGRPGEFERSEACGEKRASGRCRRERGITIASATEMIAAAARDYQHRSARWPEECRAAEK